MAVSEEELGIRPKAAKSVHYIAKTVLKGSAVLHAGYGNIRSPFSSDIVLGKETSIELVVIGEDGVLHSVCEQSIFGIIKDLCILRWNWAFRPSVPEAYGKDLIVVLSDSGKLTFLSFSIKMHRFFSVAHVHLSQPGNIRHQLGRILAADPNGRFIAVSAYENQIAIFPISPSGGNNFVDKKILFPAHLEGSTSPTRDAEDSILGTIWNFCFVSRDFSHGITEPYDPILSVIIHRKGEVSNELLLLEFNNRDSSIHVSCRYKEGGPLFVTVDAVPHLPGFLLLFKIGEILLMDIRDPYRPQSLCKTSLSGLAPIETRDASSECYKTSEADEEGICNAAACALLELSDSGMEISKEDDPMTIDGESMKLAQSSCFVCTWSWESEKTTTSRMILCTDDGELYMLEIDFDNLGSLKVTINECLYRGLPCKTLLWVKEGFVATFVEMGDGLVLKFEDGRLFYQSSIQNISPILDVSIVGTHDDEQDQIFAGCGVGPEGSLRIIRSGTNIEKLLKTSPIYQGVTGIWSLRMKKHDMYHSFLVISFVEETRVLSVGVSFSDVTDSIGFMSDTCTLSCGLVEDGVLVQICRHSVQISVPTFTDHPEGISSSCPMHKSWRPDGLTINLGAVGNNLIIVATSNPCYICILGVRLSSTCNYEVFEIQNIKLQAEVSCMSVPQNDFTAHAPPSDTTLKKICGNHNASFPSGIEIGKTFVIGTHKPSVELLCLVPKEGFKVLAVGNISLANATGTTLSWCIPQDVRIVLLDHFYILSGLRNGMLLWFQWPVISSSSENVGTNRDAVDIHSMMLPFATEGQQYVPVSVNDMPKDSSPVQLQLVALRRIGVTPVFLSPLSESLHTDIIALCGRPWLLRTARHSQRIAYTSISFQSATHVTPVSSADCPNGILFVAENCLHLVELVNIKRLNAQKIQLGGTPRRILFHSETKTLLIMRTESSGDLISTSDICRVDPLSGFMNSCFKFDPGETPKCMQFIKVGSEQLLVVGTSLSLGRLIMPSGEAESAKGRLHVFCLETAHNSDSSSIALGSKSGSSAQLSSPFREIVGYAAEELSNSSLCSSPDDNNLEGMKIEETEALQLRTIHLLKLSGAVLAVCPYLDRYLLLSASNILYVYGFVNENPQRLKKLASTRTRFVITCLTAHHNRIAVGDCRDGILFYSYLEDQNKLEQIYCDPCQRLVADCALLNLETAFVSDRRGSVSVLSSFTHLEDNACPEQNLTICCSYFMGETIMRVRKGFFSYRLPIGDAKKVCSSRSEMLLDSSDHTVIGCSLLGSVVIFIPLSRDDHDLLEAVQAKLVVHPLTAPILGNVHSEFRGRGSPVGIPQILDGDMLSQFLELTNLQQQAVLSSDLTGSTSSSSKAKLSPKSSLPVERVVQLLERLHNSLS